MSPSQGLTTGPDLASAAYAEKIVEAERLIEEGLARLQECVQENPTLALVQERIRSGCKILCQTVGMLGEQLEELEKLKPVETKPAAPKKGNTRPVVPQPSAVPPVNGAHRASPAVPISQNGHKGNSAQTPTPTPDAQKTDSPLADSERLRKIAELKKRLGYS